MALRDILTDKNSINILKALFDKEIVLKDKFSSNFDDIRKKIKIIGNPDHSLNILQKSDLIMMDKAKNKLNISITEKGKQFIFIFNQLRLLTQEKVEHIKKKSFKIEYGLTKMEKKILIILQKLTKETGSAFISQQSLSEEIYPLNKIENKSARLSPYLKKLESIQLINKQKQGKEVFISLTDRAQKTIKEQLIEEIIESY